MSGAVLLMATSGGLSVKVAPSSVVGSGLGTVTTNQAMTGTVLGGTAPYSYSWITAGDTDIVAVSPLNQSTLFRRTGVTLGNVYSAAAILTVSDSSGQTASANGAVTITGV